MTSDPHDLVAPYALNALDRVEQEHFEGHLAHCRSCQIELAQLRTSVTTLAEAAATPVPAELRQRVLTEITSTDQIPATVPDPSGATPADLLDARRARRLQRRAGRGRLLMTAAAAILLVAATVATATILTRGTGQPTNELAVIQATPDAQTLTLDGPTGSIEVIWSATLNQVALQAGGLPDPGPGHRYQLWRIEGPQAIPSGLFQPDTNGTAHLIAPLNGTPDAWGVTIEPEHGSLQPTPPILYSGNL
jgi:hypothetical protein